MTSRHPNSQIVTRSGFPSPAHLESVGESWNESNVSAEYLIGFCAQTSGAADLVHQTPAVLEMQRRLKSAIDLLTKESAANAAEQLAYTARLHSAIDEFKSVATHQTAELIRLSHGADGQTRTMIRLTQWIIALTVILGFIAGLQLWAMLAKGA